MDTAEAWKTAGEEQRAFAVNAATIYAMGVALQSRMEGRELSEADAETIIRVRTLLLIGLRHEDS